MRDLAVRIPDSWDATLSLASWLAPSLIASGMSAADPSGIFGGVRVSDKEQSFIAEVKKVVGVG